MAKGGRIGGATALLGSVLNIKPVLTITGGQVDAFDKARTHRRVMERLKQLVAEQMAPDGLGYLSLMHADAAEELSAYFCNEFSLDEIPMLAVPPAFVTHGGPGVLGVGFFTG